MNAQVIYDGPPRVFALIFDSGDEVMTALADFAGREGLRSAHFTAIGAFQNAELGYFELQKKDYKKIPIQEQVEVLSLVGDVAMKDGKPAIHAHVVLGRSDAAAVGGHLLKARVRPTLEVILTESPGHLQRRYDPDTGLALIRLGDRTRAAYASAFRLWHSSDTTI